MKRFDTILRLSLILELLLMSIAPGLEAAAPALLTYQGRLKEAGLPVTAARNVEILLCDHPTNPTATSCTSTGVQQVSAVNGLFRSTFTVPTPIDVTTGLWYLELKIGAQTLSPRERLTSSLYAVYASSASTLVANPNAFGVAIATNVTVAGRLGVGTTAPNYELHVASDVISGEAQLAYFQNTGSGLAVATVKIGEGAPTNQYGVLGHYGVDNSFRIGNLGPSGNNGYLSFHVGLNTSGANGTTLNSSNELMRIANSGNLGIGTTSPAARLHVSSASAAAADTVFQVSSGTAAGQELLIVKGDGRVGIGTSPGGVKLEVAGGAKLAGNLQIDNGSGAIPFAAVTITNVSGEHGSLGIAAGGGLDLASGADAPLRIRHTQTNGTAAIQFATANTDRMTIASGGGVGVGTTSPVARLHVSSGTGWSGDIVVVSTGSSSLARITGQGEVIANKFIGDGSGLTGLSGTDSTKVLKAGDTMTGQLTLAGSTLTVTGNAFSVGGSTFTVAGGNVGIGTTNPGYGLQVSAASGAPIATFSGPGAVLVGGPLGDTDASIKMGFVASGHSWIQSYGNVPLYIDELGNDVILNATAGNVGVGTTVPAAKLDVNGAAQFGSTAKSTFTATGALSLAAGAPLALSGPAGTITSGSSVTASAFFGNGANLSGVVATGIADAAVQTAKLAADAVDSAKLLNGAVTGPKLAGSSVDSGKLAANAVWAANIQDGAVQAADLAVNAVQAIAIQNGAVETAKLANDAVTFPKIAQNGCTANQVIQWSGSAWLCSSSAGVADGSIDSVKLATNAVWPANLNAGAVQTAKLAADAVDSAKILNGAITFAKMASNGCAAGQVMKRNAGNTAWECAADTGGAGSVSVAPATADADASANPSIFINDTSGGSLLRLQQGSVDRFVVDNTGAIATASVGNAAIVGGAVDTGKLAADAVTAAKLLSDSAGLSKVSGGLAIVSGGNLGIGTANPAYKVHALGDELISGQVIVGATMTVQGNSFSVGNNAGAPNFSVNWLAGGGGGPRIGIQSNGTGLNGELLDIGDGNNPSGIRINAGGGTASTLSFATMGAQRAYLNVNGTAPDLAIGVQPFGTLATLTRTGNVGVGTASPAARLHVSSASAAAADTVFQVSSGTTAGQELLVVKGDGKIGIGTAGPTAKLHMSSGTLLVDGAGADVILPDGSIGTAEIASLAVDSAKLAASSVNSGKLSANAVWPANINVAAVETTKLAADAVDATKILNNAITFSKIGANGCAANELMKRDPSGTFWQCAADNSGGTAGGDLSGAYPNPTIAAAAVNSAKLALGAVDSDRLAANAADTGKIKDDSVTAAKLITGAVQTAKLAADAVTGAAILNGAVTALKLANTAVAAGSYGSATQVGQFTVDAQGRLTASANVTIAGVAPGGAAGGDLTGAYPNPAIAAAAVNSAKLALGAVDSDRLAANAVTAGKIAALAVGGAQLQGSSVASAQIADGGVATVDLQAGAVDTGKLAADAVDSTKIRNGAVNTDKVGADAVTSSKLLNDPASLSKVTAGGMTMSAGKVGIGTPAPTIDLSFGNSGAKTIGMETAAAGAGSALTVRAGSAGVGPTGGGGALFLTAGSGTSSSVPGGDVTVTAGDGTAGTTGGHVVLIGGSFPASGRGQIRMEVPAGTVRVRVTDSAVTVTGPLTVTGSISGDGSGLTNIGAGGLAAGAVDTAKLAADAVDSGKMLNGAVSLSKLAANSVDSSKIVDGAIGSDKIANGGIATGKLGNSVVLTANINDAAVTLAKLATGSVDSSKIVALSIDSTRLMDFLIDSWKLKANSIDSTKIVDGAISSDKIANGGVGSGKLAANVVATPQLVDGAVSSAKLAANSVDSLKIVDGAVGSDKIANLGVGTAKLVDAAVTAPKLADGAVQTAKLANDAVTLPKIAQNGCAANDVIQRNPAGTAWVCSPAPGIANDSIDSTKLQTNSVTSPKIAAAAVDSTKLAANAVWPANLNAAAVETAKLAADAVTTAKLLDAAVTASKLSATGVTAGTYGSATQATQFTVDAQGRLTAVSNVTISGVSPTGAGLASGAIWVGNASIQAAPQFVSGDATLSNGGALTISAGRVDTGKLSADAVDSVKLLWDPGSLKKVAGGRMEVIGADINIAGALSMGGNSFVTQTGFLRLVDGTAAIPPVSFFNENNSGLFRPVANALGFATSGIERARLDSTKLSAGLVIESTSGGFKFPDGTTMVTATIDSSKLATASVSTGKLAIDAVDSGKILNGAVIASKLAAGAIDTSAKFAAGVVDASAIKLGAVDTDRLGGAAVTSAKIAAGAVDTSKLAADAVDSGKLRSDYGSLAKVTGGLMSVGIDTGKVGIGTSSPGSRLTVDSGASAATLAIVSTVAAGGAEVLFHNTRAGGGSNADTGRFYGINPGATFDSGQIRIDMLGGPGSYSNVATFSGAGNVAQVGIGTTVPQYTLDVGGAMRVQTSSLTFTGMAAPPPASAAGQGALYFNTASNRFLVSENGQAFTALTLIDTTKLATDAVDSAKILNGAVATAKLAADSVDSTKILNGAVTLAKTATGGILIGKSVFTTPGAGTWTKPAGCRFVVVEAVGGGGGGGGAAASGAATVTVGGGGGGGGYATARVDCSLLGATEPLTVGGGGPGGSTTGTSGAIGTNTTFGATIRAQANAGGGGAGGATAGVLEGSSGGGAGSGTTGDFLMTGGGGMAGYGQDGTPAVALGGGGGAAANGGGGAAAAVVRSGAAIQSAGAGGGNYGGGGGGAASVKGGTGAAGGNGAGGMIIVWEYQ